MPATRPAGRRPPLLTPKVTAWPSARPCAANRTTSAVVAPAVEDSVTVRFTRLARTEPSLPVTVYPSSVRSPWYISASLDTSALPTPSVSAISWSNSSYRYVVTWLGPTPTPGPVIVTDSRLSLPSHAKPVLIPLPSVTRVARFILSNL